MKTGFFMLAAGIIFFLSTLLLGELNTPSKAPPERPIVIGSPIVNDPTATPIPIPPTTPHTWYIGPRPIVPTAPRIGPRPICSGNSGNCPRS